jgi:hypothetical protein
MERLPRNCLSESKTENDAWALTAIWSLNFSHLSRRIPPASLSLCYGQNLYQFSHSTHANEQFVAFQVFLSLVMGLLGSQLLFFKFFFRAANSGNVSLSLMLEVEAYRC